MLQQLQQLVKRHEELQRIYESDDSDQSEDSINKEQDQIVDEVFAIIRDNTKGLAAIRAALAQVSDVIECTYGHEDDEDGESQRLDDEPGEDSAADIVEKLCNVELAVTEAIELLDGK